MRYFENEQVFALYPEDKTWYPARYVSKNGNKYTVNWLDRIMIGKNWTKI